MNSKAKILFRGSGLRALNFFIMIASSFILMPLLINYLGDRLYGFWILIGSFNGFYQTFDFGVDSATQRYVSKAVSKNDFNEANIALNTSLFIYSIIGIIVFLGAVIFAISLPIFIKNSTDIFTLRLVALICGTEVAISFPFRAFSGVLTAHLRFDLKTIIEIFRVASRTILILLLIKIGGGILNIAIACLLTSIASYILIYILTRVSAKYIVINRRLVIRKRMKEIFNYSFFIFLGEFANRLKFDLDNFVITIFIGVSSVTLYSIASRLIKYFMGFLSTSLGITMPLFSHYEAQNDYQSIREKFVLITKISCIFSICLGSIILLTGKVFIERWVGKQYSDAYTILIILLIPNIISSMQMPTNQLLQGISKHKFYAISNLLEGILNLILSIILAKKFGLIGVALGTAIPMIINKTIIQPIYTCNFIKLKYNQYYFSILFRSLILFAMSYVIFHLTLTPLLNLEYLRMLFVAMIQLLVLSVVLFTIFDKREKKYLFELIKL